MPSFFDLIGHPATVVILGPKRSGKTALACRILEEAHRAGYRTIIAPNDDISDLVPEYIELIDPMFFDPRRYPQNSVILLDDVHLKYHARAHSTSEALLFDEILSISGHLQITFIITTQFAARADINYLRDADNTFIKKPTQRMMRNDRTEFRNDLKEAYAAFQENDPSDPRKHVWISTYNDVERLSGSYDIPEWFTPELSSYMSRANLEEILR